MPATIYSDRVTLTVNGLRLEDVISANLERNENTKYVPTMTSNRRNKGYVQGNVDFTGEIVLAVQSTLGTPKMEEIDFSKNDVTLTFAHGGDRYQTVDLIITRTNNTAGGVGTEGRKSYSIMATDVIDQVGNSSLFNLSFNT